MRLCWKSAAPHPQTPSPEGSQSLWDAPGSWVRVKAVAAYGSESGLRVKGGSLVVRAVFRARART